MPECVRTEAGGRMAGCEVNRRHDFRCPFLAGLNPWARASASLMNFPCLVFPYQRVPG